MRKCNKPQPPSSPRLLTNADRLRDFCAHVQQFCLYIDDCVTCPDLVDLDVVQKKNEAVMKLAKHVQTEAMKGVYK